jgi:hypothetical protein
MIPNYKFQDLAKLVEDLQFLLAKGGTPGDRLSKAKYYTKVTGFVFWTVFKGIIYYVILYTIYQIIFYGYPRFLVDMFKLKFYNKVDLKGTLNANELLYKQFRLLMEGNLESSFRDFQKLDEDYDNIKKNLFASNVFLDVSTTLINHYSKEFPSEDDRFNAAFIDYFGYYDSITSVLNIKGLQINNKRALIESLKYSVLRNYINLEKDKSDKPKSFYDIIMNYERNIVCRGGNDGKTDVQRAKINMKNKHITRTYNEFKKRWGIVKIETSKNFAKRFVDPVFAFTSDRCGDTLETIYIRMLTNEVRYNNLLEEKQRLAIDKRKMESKLKWPHERTKKNKSKLREIEKQLKNVDPDIEKLEAEILAKAEKEFDDPVKFNNPNKFFSIGDIAFLKDDLPDMTEISNTEEHNSIYVPCFNIYKEYYETNKQLFSHLQNTKSKSNEGMTPNEIVAYIFLSDLQNILRIQTNKNTTKEKPTIILEKIVDTYLSMENMLYACNQIISPSRQVVGKVIPREFLQYIVFPDKKALEHSIVEFYNIITSSSLKPLLEKAYRKNDIHAFDELKIKEQYTYYLLELHYVNQHGENIFYTFQNQSGLSDKPPNVISYINLPLEMQQKKEIQNKFGVQDNIIKFTKTHPLFTWVYLNSSNSIQNIYKQILNMITKGLLAKPFENVYNDTIEKIEFEKKSFLEVKNMIEKFQERIFNMKKSMIGMYIINLFFNRYRDDFETKDQITKMRIVQDGLVSIYQDQNIPIDIEPFFQRLFKPFKIDFIDGRIVALWKRTFHPPKFRTSNPNSYWRTFRAFYIDYLGKIMDRSIKSYWKNVRGLKKRV